MRKKIFITILLIVIVTFSSGITYSFFNSNANMKSSDQKIASFIFDANSLDKIDLNLSDFKPGDKKEYLFSVKNTNDNSMSDVTIEYQLNIKTYHLMPLTIDLYLVNGEKEEFIGTCDEKAKRNSENELVCDMPTRILVNSKEEKDDYKLKITFPSKYNDISYSNLVDYINIEISSWQKI